MGILFSCLISISVVGLKETFMFWIFKKTHLDIKKQNKNTRSKRKKGREKIIFKINIKTLVLLTL